MRPTFSVALALIALALPGYCQDDVPTFKAEAESAFVWGGDGRSGVLSSSVRDPLTGYETRKLNHAGVEVSSQVGFETIVEGPTVKLLTFTTTIVNNTDAELSVRSGRASVDGHVAQPLPLVLTKKGLRKKERKQVWELASMNCFSSGFLPNEVFLSPKTSSTVFTVAPKKVLTVSFVIKDPRYYSVACSVEGCYPKGTIRFSVTVNATDFVFVWPGRDMASCGK